MITMDMTHAEYKVWLAEKSLANAVFQHGWAVKFDAGKRSVRAWAKRVKVERRKLNAAIRQAKKVS